MRYEIYKDFKFSLQKLYQKGGRYQKAAEKAKQVVGDIQMNVDPFKGLKTTNHGENRIKHCIKFDLIGFCRLITIRDNGVWTLCYVGNHEDSDNWLERNQGLTLIVNSKNELITVRKSIDVKHAETRLSGESDLADGPLIKRISTRYIDKISGGVPYSLMQKFSELGTISDEDDILKLALDIENDRKTDVFFDVFLCLRNGDIDGAKQRVDLFDNESREVGGLTDEEIKSLFRGEDFFDFEHFKPEDTEHIMRAASFQQWMLFMHPEQRKIAHADYSGPARLSGVSGSGKTCVVIKRAIHLAKKYPEEEILILTLNRSLARLIEGLVDYVCQKRYRNKIIVQSFWELCRDELRNFDLPDFDKRFRDVTWKMDEHISEIWEEYYHCLNNNFDAEVFFPVHQSLLNRAVFPKDYLYQELDYIRSAFSKDETDAYLKMERQGRFIAFEEHFREMILKGLEGWEKKMVEIGTTDYLGLASTLYEYVGDLQPKYRCILVDEIQDFGLLELRIIRKLVAEKENDIFLSGDTAQQVYTKYHNFPQSGIDIRGRSISCKKNYRNSREILSASFTVLKNNVPEDAIRNADIEIIDPEYANFSTPKPLILFAQNLAQEFAYTINYLRNILDTSHEKACVALCGYTIREVKTIGQGLSLPILDGDTDIDSGEIFLSDLEQTKGFEFDRMCIINCASGTIPDKALPEEEWYREVFKLYVAMTRAKRELILSYSDSLSEFLLDCKEKFLIQNWNLQEENNSLKDFVLPTPSNNRSYEKSILENTGKDFLYFREAVGIPKEVQDKLLQAVRGKSVSANGRQKEWQTIKDLLKFKDIPTKANMFGPQTYDSFVAFFRKYESLQ